MGRRQFVERDEEPKDAQEYLVIAPGSMVANGVKALIEGDGKADMLFSLANTMSGIAMMMLDEYSDKDVEVKKMTEEAVFQDPATPEQRLNRIVFEALGAASTCWTPDTGDAVFDSDRAKAIGEALVEDIKNSVPSVLREPFLGYATTKQLIDELHARADVSATIREAWPSYRTAGDS